MVSDLKALSNHPFDEYRSHRDKPLRVHTNGVMEGVHKRTGLEVAAAASLFHDLGKLNPNFQPKLDGVAVSDYSSHAYLSSHAFLCFCKTNQKLLREVWGFTHVWQIFSVLALISHHHGSLPNSSSILSLAERERLEAFLVTKPHLPISDYLQQWLKHDSFDVLDPKYNRLMEEHWRMADKYVTAIKDKLDFFLSTQFGFASLIESDKRDAGNNKVFKRDEQLQWARDRFSACLHQALNELKINKDELNRVRTAVRLEAVGQIQKALEQGHRVFSLIAPTGAGKTFTLLALADEIRRTHPDLSVLYSLPFLTITEQVESVCRDIVFCEAPSFVTRIDSRAHNKTLEHLLSDLENQPEKISDLLQESFSQETFDAAFVITTFVQFFETLLSNRGATLLRLPNFSKCIFLLDEIQALPPRLYVFLTAYLHAFCEKFDSFAVLSTATMPALNLPEKNVPIERDSRRLFPHYRPPAQLLDFQRYYEMPVFDRYEIGRLDEDNPAFSLSDLASAIQDEQSSCLVILNTIEDTRQLYNWLCPDGPRQDVVLLNTRFTLNDRRTKIAACKERLQQGEHIVLIATQLIEAGVDIDFPVVYRDLCPLPNLIQSAGRCNRNGKLKQSEERKRGSVLFFELRDDEGKPRAELIYRETSDQWILDFSRNQVRGKLSEGELLRVQREFFDLINQNLAVGDHRLRVGDHRQRDNLIQRVNEGAFEIVGSFRLIDEDLLGTEIRFYVPTSQDDEEWEKLDQMTTEAAKAAAVAGGRLPFNEMKRRQVAIDAQLRSMSGQIVQVRIRDESEAPPSLRRNGEIKEVCGLRKLLLPDIDYSEHTGIQMQGQGVAIL